MKNIITHKKKRIRKKYHLKEFAEYGLHIEAKWKSNSLDSFYDDFCDFMDKHLSHIGWGGGGNDKTIGFYFSSNNYKKQITNDDVNKIMEFWEKTNLFIDITRSEFCDSWHEEIKCEYKG